MNIEDKFGSHVKSVFDNYEDGGADQGWAELIKKHPERGLGAAPSRKVIPMQYWWAAAAAVVLVSFIVFFANEQPIRETQIAGKKQIPRSETEQPVIGENNIAQPTLPMTPSASPDKSSMQVQTTYSKQPSVAALPEGKRAEAPSVEQQPEADYSAQQPTEPAVTQQPINEAVAFKPATENAEKRPATIEEFLDRESKNNTVLASNEKKAQALTSFDIYAGTFLNYFEDNPAKVNAGFGVNANVKLTKKIFLSVGAGLSENTVTYENSLPKGSVESLAASFPLDQSKGLNSPVTKPGGGSYAESTLSFVAKSSGPSTDVKLNATLLNLDVPIALKFYAGKNDRFYLLTGINSNSYINQRYMQTYSTYNYVSSMTETVQQEVESSRLSGFDFANSAIFAIGVSQDLGKTTKLTFEPFYRPSLKGLGDNNIRLNTIGVNLKLSLKKK